MCSFSKATSTSMSTSRAGNFASFSFISPMCFTAASTKLRVPMLMVCSACGRVLSSVSKRPSVQPNKRKKASSPRNSPNCASTTSPS